MSKRWFAPRDCYDLLRDGHNVSGVYEVYLAKARKFVRVYCDMDSNDGGWLVRPTQTQILNHANTQTHTYTNTHKTLEYIHTGTQALKCTRAHTRWSILSVMAATVTLNKYLHTY